MAERCKICANKVRKPGIDAALTAGLTAAQIARDADATGWPLDASTVVRHREHYITDPKAAHPGIHGRDLLAVVRDMTLEAIDEGRLDIEDKNWKNVGPGITAQKGMDQREFKKDDRKTALAMGILLAGGNSGFTAPVQLLGDGMTVEGEYEELPEDE